MRQKRGPILFATDFSTASRAALEQAIGLSRTTGAPLLLAHVVISPAPLGMNGAVFPQTYYELEAEIRKDAERRLGKLLERTRRSAPKTTAALVRGVPHEEILKLARSRKARLIVAGTHGRTGLPRLVVGSVASRLVAGASCPVLTVRGK